MNWFDRLNDYCTRKVEAEKLTNPSYRETMEALDQVNENLPDNLIGHFKFTFWIMFCFFIVLWAELADKLKSERMFNFGARWYFKVGYWVHGRPPYPSNSV